MLFGFVTTEISIRRFFSVKFSPFPLPRGHYIIGDKSIRDDWKENTNE